MIQSWMSDRAIWIRLVMAVVLVGYLAIITVTHFVALPLQLEVPLVLTGWGLTRHLERVQTRAEVCLG
jgi:hypothetical protein